MGLVPHSHAPVVTVPEWHLIESPTTEREAINRHVALLNRARRLRLDYRSMRVQIEGGWGIYFFMTTEHKERLLNE